MSCRDTSQAMNGDKLERLGGELESHLHLEPQGGFFLFFLDYTNAYLEAIVCVHGHHHRNTQPQQQ